MKSTNSKGKFPLVLYRTIKTLEAIFQGNGAMLVSQVSMSNQACNLLKSPVLFAKIKCDNMNGR